MPLGTTNRPNASAHQGFGSGTYGCGSTTRYPLGDGQNMAGRRGYTEIFIFHASLRALASSMGFL